MREIIAENKKQSSLSAPITGDCGRAATRFARKSGGATGAEGLGLLNSAITSESRNSNVFEPSIFAKALWQPRFPSVEMVSAAGALFTQCESDDFFTRVAHRLVISPGSVQLKQTLVKGSAIDPISNPDEWIKGQRYKLEPFLIKHLAERPKPTPRNIIQEWSRKSRANMVRRLATLDYEPLLAQGSTPGLITLTLPGNWQAVCKDAKQFQRFLRNWRDRFRYDWQRNLVGIWKREFQRRGAAHFHIFMAVPDYCCPRTGETFKAWVSRTWAEVVGAEGEEFEKHLKAGTGVDFAEAVNMRDPRRLAIYFLKAESGASGQSSKEYQHIVPEEWAGKSVGRWWGFWGLKPLECEIELTREDWVEIARTMRRYTRAQRRTAQVERVRHKIDPATGEILKTYTRKTRVRKYFFKGRGSGFALLNDGANFASALAYVLELRRRERTSRE